MGGKRDGGVPGAAEGVDPCVELLVRLVRVSQVREDAVLAVDVRIAEQLARHGQDALAVLAGRLTISCSTQSPKLGIGSDTANVSLSRPSSARAPITAPSQSPELAEPMSSCAQFASATWARWSIASMVTPASAAGTSPNGESTE